MEPRSSQATPRSRWWGVSVVNSSPASPFPVRPEQLVEMLLFVSILVSTRTTLVSSVDGVHVSERPQAFDRGTLQTNSSHQCTTKCLFLRNSSKATENCAPRLFYKTSIALHDSDPKHLLKPLESPVRFRLLLLHRCTPTPSPSRQVKLGASGAGNSLTERAAMASSLPAVPRVKLGSQGLEVSALGLGCMGMSAFYGPAGDEVQMVKLIRHAVDSGVTFLDTADVYGPHTNEVLVGKALKGIRDKVQIATKFAFSLDAEGNFSIRGDPEHVRAACEGSLKRLGVDYIDLYYQHRVDQNVPIEVTVGEMKKLVEEGKVKYLGLSEASASDIRRAHAVHPITAVQIEWSLWVRELESDIIPVCRELGIGIVPYSPLGRGFIAGTKVEELSDTDFRRVAVPFFQGENLEKNKVLLARVAKIAEAKKCTTSQLALAWVIKKGAPTTVPIPGTTKIANLEANIGALGVELTDAEMKALEEAVPATDIAGTRYADASLKFTWQHSSSPPLSSWKGSASA